MERLKPDPIPVVDPVWEHQAEGDLRDAYEAYKAALQIPWVGVVALAYARRRRFFDVWWAGMAPIVASQRYVEACFGLRAEAEAAVAALAPPAIGPRLDALGYSPRERAQIDDMIEALSHGNFVQLLAVFAARHLLEGGALTGGGDAGPPAAAHAPARETPIVLIEPHHALADHQALYADVRATLGLPFVNTDYRCLARWPSYFAAAWGDLRGVVASPAYEAAAAALHRRIVEEVARLPNPAGLAPEDVRAAAAASGDLAGAHETTKLFTWLLPGLMLNVAYFRAQLRGG